jgi:hypothetical protein
MTGIDGTIMTEIVLIATTVATASALSKSASVIFEADELFPAGAGMRREAVQEMKRRKVMPKLWAPIWQMLLGEVILMLALLSGVAEGTGAGLLILTIIFFLGIAILLARHFYLAGGKDDDSVTHGSR